jgi:hypothetical protein
METRYELISKSKIRQFLKEYVCGEITEDTIVYLQGILEQHAIDICCKVLEEHKRINQRRKECGLPEYKRIHIPSTYLNRGDEGYIPPSCNSGCGEVGQTNKDTTFSGE